MQLNLLNVGHTPRPKINDKKVHTKFVEALLPKVLRWLKSQGDNPPDSEIDHIKSELFNATQYDYDGHRIAMRLNVIGWETDLELSEILDSASNFLRFETRDKLIEEWIVQQVVLPEYSVGTRVSFQVGLGASSEGVITAINEKRATYSIETPIDNVKPGAQKLHHVEYEKCKKIE